MPMAAALPQCTRCYALVPVSQLNHADMQPCASCGSLLRVEVFPALFRPAPAEQRPEALVLASEASCFYHPESRAVLPCDACGRFVCALCDCEVRGRHFCPSCLETGRTKGRIKNLENERILYDNIALGLAVLPVALLVGIYFTFITAPMAIFIALRHWNSPGSIIPRTKIRLVLAIVLAAAQIIGWAVLLYVIISQNG